jgi:C1A family cysteine protease
MKLTLFLIVLAAAVSITYIVFSNQETITEKVDLDSQFFSFISSYGKSYKSQDEI